ncbi:hypothetical protein BT69DRAFT_495152 [Atractiella rhizophila]|nr:hypothetical protein BT69DRAFT_495152 [Atractiella rhizophila]
MTSSYLSIPMPSGYNPLIVESNWYDWWEASGFFRPIEDSSKGTFVIIAPPPNVTGQLHLGHALTLSIQDGLIRWARMSGLRTLYVPGLDHAGISTQSVVEKRIWKNEGKRRMEFTREDFVKRIWEWKDEYAARINAQFRRLGGSFDWERSAFSLDDARYKAVIHHFCKLYDEKIIYRANRLVNWCVHLNTTLSTLEVDQKELAGRTFLSVPGYDPKEKFEFGVLTEFAYQIENSDERIIVATTRPETMLGDTGIAVHPDDPRYKHLHGKFAVHPFVDRRLPIITDAKSVDMEFGTGAVKMTPGHDYNDYETGKRNGLEILNVLNDDGTFNSLVGEKFKGMKRFHARKAVVEALKEKGLFVSTKDNPMKVPVCSKSGDIIEPLLKPQWWVNCSELAQRAVERTDAKEFTITPKSSEKEWYNWMATIQDWCISRQLWWGHRCPAYFVKLEGEEDADSSREDLWIVAETEEEAQKKAAEKFPGKKFVLEQDEDVLDTWFSSGLWPFSTLGWPEDSQDMKDFYPTAILVTGWDILFFWVARMVMLGIHHTGKVPFNEVFCHAMIRDAHGRKMSKTLGNVINPIDLIEGCSLEELHAQLRVGNLDAAEISKAEAGQKKDYPNGIPQCGTDAMRFTLCAYTSNNRDINLDVLKVEGYRKFCNKLFNATKFAMLKFEDGFVPEASENLSGSESLVERWILHRLNETCAAVDTEIRERNFMAVTGHIYNYWLYELCDVYIEAIKPITDPSAPAAARRSAQNTLYTALDSGLRLMHPFMPYVTEELWQRLPRRKGDTTPSIMVSKYPTFEESRRDSQAEKDFDAVFTSVKSIRSLAATYNLRTNIQAFLEPSSSEVAELFEREAPIISTLVKGSQSIQIVKDKNAIPSGCATESISSDITAHLLVRGLIDFDQEITKAEKKITLTNMNVERLEKQMNAPDYETKIREDVRNANAEKMRDLNAELETLRQSIENFKLLKG